ncbi:unnamed protein product [Cylindrotheca closterium]|uniref:Uncharacterized protein n=1 Tax=Cylindrotheca closterium TaxID=2856 RepID=A0AAD2JK45_9STRA|nr:unnamed protein product [Cylindrotheca closterium]
MAIQALLCDNHDSDESTEAIQKVLAAISEKQRSLNNQLRTKISRLVLAILRVRPFQQRMEKIFEYKYENPNNTMDDMEAQPLDDKKSSGTSRSEENEEEDPNGAEEAAVEISKSIIGTIFGF